MIELKTFLDKLSKNVNNLSILSSKFQECSFAEKYSGSDLSFSKKCLIIYASSAIMRRDIEINSHSMLKELNSRLPGRKFIRNIEVRVRKK